MNTLYIGCALQGASEEWLAFVTSVKQEAAKLGFEVKEFIGLAPDATPAAVYETDITCASEADIMLALVDRPSTGLGMELQKRIELKKRTLICFTSTVGVSRMVLGAAEQYDFISAHQYDTIEDIRNILQTL